MKKVLLASVCLLTAAPAFAHDTHCPPGRLNVWGACVDPSPGYGYEMPGRYYSRDDRRGHHHHRGYHRHHRHHRHCHK